MLQRRLGDPLGAGRGRVMNPLAPYMQGIHGKVPARRKILPRVRIRLYRAPVTGQRFEAEENFLAEGYAHRQDRNVASGEVEGVVVYTKQREYKLLRDIRYKLPDAEQGDGCEGMGLGASTLGECALGGAQAPPGTGIRGVQAQRGMLLKDAETNQVFQVSGITREPAGRMITISCGEERIN